MAMLASGSDRIGIIFHGIGTPGRQIPDDEANYWISTPHFEAVLDRVAALPDPGRIRISFDDGNASDYHIALPRLLDRGLTADFFVLTGRLDSAGSLSTAEVRALQAAGMRIGSHGIAHLPWARLPAPELETELTASRLRLTAICGRPVTEAGIPFGNYDARVLRALERTGYSAAYSSDGGWMDERAFLRPRTSITDDTDEEALEAILAGQMPPMRRLRRSLGMMRKQMAGRLSA